MNVCCSPWHGSWKPSINLQFSKNHLQPLISRIIYEKLIFRKTLAPRFFDHIPALCSGKSSQGLRADGQHPILQAHLMPPAWWHHQDLAHFLGHLPAAFRDLLAGKPWVTGWFKRRMEFHGFPRRVLWAWLPESRFDGFRLVLRLHGNQMICQVADLWRLNCLWLEERYPLHPLASF